MSEYEDYAQKGWRRVYEQVIDYWQVLHYGKHPKHCSVYYNRLQLIAYCNYPNKEQRRSFFRRCWHMFIVTHVNLFSLTMMLALPESAHSIVDMGQDLLWIIGTLYLIFKWQFLHLCADKVDEVVNELEDCHRECKNEWNVKEIRAHQRYHFIAESTASFIWHIGVIIFIILGMMQPLLSKQILPFHAIYPFEWHNPEKHPTAHAIIYVWQCVALFYNLKCILYCEILSSHIFTQIGCNLKILCLELEGLSKIDRDNLQLFRSELYKLVEFHQRIINLVENTNLVFYAPMVMQFFASFLLICLSTFVSLIARHEPSVAIRFVIFSALTFFHLSYWCLTGNMVTEESQKVALAAYGSYLWSPYKKEIQHDIMFIIRRAQLPLSMEASPFPPLNLLSYTAILKQCYSILTVLLESLD